jgi:hypothetical protein
MNTELERMWKETVFLRFDALSLHFFSGGNDENIKPLIGLTSISEPTIEVWTSAQEWQSLDRSIQV